MPHCSLFSFLSGGEYPESRCLGQRWSSKARAHLSPSMLSLPLARSFALSRRGEPRTAMPTARVASCGRQASLAPPLWDALIDRLFHGRWFLVFSSRRSTATMTMKERACSTPDQPTEDERVPAVELVTSRFHTLGKPWSNKLEFRFKECDCLSLCLSANSNPVIRSGVPKRSRTNYCRCS